MAKVIKTENQEKLAYEPLNTSNDVTAVSKSKIFKMRKKMQSAFEEIKLNQKQLRHEHDSLVFAQKELQLWQENYVKLFNMSSVGYFTIYKDLIVKEVNDAAIEMLGYDKFEIIGQPFIVHGESSMRDKLRSYFSQVFNGKAGSLEVSLITNNDSDLPVLIQSELVSDSAGAVQCCLCSVIDMSEIYQLRDSLDKSHLDIEQMIDEHKAQLNKVLAEVKSKSQQLENDKKNWQKSQAEFEMVLDTQTIQLGEYKLKNQQLTQSLNDSAAEKKLIENRCAQLEETFQIHAVEFDEYKKYAEDLQKKLEESLKNKEALENKCFEFESLIKEQTFELANLKGQIEKATIEAEEFKARNIEYQEYKRQAAQKQSQLDEQLQCVSQQFKDYQHQAAQKQNQLNGQLQVVSQQFKDYQHQANLEKQKMAYMVKQRSKKIAELVERIENIKANSAEKVKQLQQQLDDTERVLGGKVNELSIVNEKLQQQVSVARDEGQQLRQRLKRTDKLLEQTQAELSVAHKQIEFNEQKIAEMQQEFSAERNELVERLSEKADELDMLNMAYQQQSEDMAAMSSAIEEANQQAKVYFDTNRRLEGALCQNRVVLKKLCDIGAITMNVYNLQQREIEYVNKHIGKVLGYSDEQIEEFGKEIVRKVMHPDDLERISKDLAGFSWDSADEMIDIEYRLQDASGSWRYIHSQEFVLSCDDNGKPIEVLGIQYDYTEKVQAKEGMKALAKIVAMVGKGQ